MTRTRVGRRVELGLAQNAAQFSLLVVVNALVADALGVRAAVWTVAALTAASGLVVAVRMYETHHSPAARIDAAKDQNG